MPDYEWRFEPIESDNPKWPHAAKGVKPYIGGRLVETGYGHTERGAMDDVKKRCADRDRRAQADDTPQERRSNPLVNTWGPAKGS